MATKNKKRVRKTGGQELYYKIGAGSWTSLGLVNTGYVVPVDEHAFEEIPIAGAELVTIEGTRKVGYEGELVQTGKDEMILVDSLNGAHAELYVYDGTVENKHQEYYFKEVEMQLSSMKKEGSLQVLNFKANAIKQDALVAIADTGLPTIKKAAAGTVTGTNNYYAIIETVVV